MTVKELINGLSLMPADASVKVRNPETGSWDDVRWLQSEMEIPRALWDREFPPGEFPEHQVIKNVRIHP